MNTQMVAQIGVGGTMPAITMSSREIAALTGKRHFHVTTDIENMLKELGEDVTDFRGIYRDSMNREQTEYLLDRELTETLLLGYSAALRRRVLRRLRELEGAAFRPEPAITHEKVVAELAIVECYDRMLRPAPSSKIAMLQRIAKNNGVDSSFLPGYAVDAAPDAAGGSSMKETWRNSEASESEVLKNLIEPDLLILDEVGVQFGSDTEKLILFEIINGRYENRRATILISNLAMDGLKAYLGDRIIDRLREGGGRQVVFDWDSFRKRPA